MDPRAESAEFAPTRILQRRGSGPVVLGLFVLVVGGLVAIGTLDRLTGRSSPPVAGPAASAGLDGVAGAPPTTVPPGAAASRPTRSPETLRLDVRLDGQHVFIHGSVLIQNVASIRLSLKEESGRTAERATVSVPGGSTAFRLGPETRFDSYMRLPDHLVGEPAWIEARAYLATGEHVATARSAVGDEGLIGVRVRSEMAGSVAVPRQLVRVDGELRARAEHVTIRLEAHDAILVLVTRDDRDGALVARVRQSVPLG